MSIDSIACLVASLALIIIAISSQHPMQNSIQSLYEFQLANDAAEALYKKNSLSKFAEYSEAGAPVPDSLLADLKQISNLTGRCILLSSSKSLYSCPVLDPKTTVQRLVPYSNGVASVSIALGPHSANT
jgi:hypothetical protein